MIAPFLLKLGLSQRLARIAAPLIAIALVLALVWWLWAGWSRAEEQRDVAREEAALAITALTAERRANEAAEAREAAREQRSTEAKEAMRRAEDENPEAAKAPAGPVTSAAVERLRR